MVEVSRVLDVLLPEAQFFIYSHVPVRLPVDSKRWTLKTDPLMWARYMRATLWLKLRAGVLCSEDDLDVFWASATLLPDLPEKVRTISTVYDLNHIVAPETMQWTQRWAHRIWFTSDVLAADRVLSISTGTAQRLSTLVGRQAAAVVRPGVSSAFRPPTPDEVMEVRRKYVLERPYFLTVGTQEPRKNLPLLIRAFSALHQEGKLQHSELVIVGSEGWGVGPCSLPSGVEPSAPVRRLGYVPDCDLPALYGDTLAFVFPSTYEGFGIPVLEARACGAPVIATDAPEIREAGGPDALYVQPTLESLQHALLNAGGLPRSQTTDNGGLPTWEEAARTFADILRNLVESPRPT